MPCTRRILDVMHTTTTMRAAMQRQYGPPSVLEIADVEPPVPGRGDVLVRVRAASVHPGDYFVMTGEPYIVRLAFGLRRPRHAIRGMDLAGVVAAVGEDVEGFEPGDLVFGWCTTGSLAEYARVPAKNLAPVPENLSLAEAAAVPTSGMTALQAMRDVARVAPGQKLLIVGASGGVGSFAVQIAASLGAEVTGVCSAGNGALVASLGADHVIDYAASDFAEHGVQYDVILDNVESRPLSVVRRALTPAGTLIPNSGKGGRLLGPIGRVIRAHVLSLFTRQRLRPFTSVGTREDLLTLAALVSSGPLTPVIDRVYPLDAAADALRHVATGHTRGKVVVTI